MSNKKYITVGENANIFHEPYSGVTVVKGQVVEVTAMQLSQKRVKQALNSGHIVYAEAPKVEGEPVQNTPAPQPPAPKVELTVEQLKAKLVDLIKEGNEASKIAKKFTLDQLKAIATDLGFEIEAEDTKQSLLEALLEEDEFIPEEVK